MNANPFRAKAAAARAKADRLNRPSDHDRAMAAMFPLGAGFGRPGGARRLERSIARAAEAVKAEQRARYFEGRADAYDRGNITAHGRSRSPAFDARTAKAAKAREGRAARIAAAKAECAGKHRLDCPAETWATACGYLGGDSRALVIADHARDLALRAQHIYPEGSK